jgi:CotH kinase protein/Lamin Tail Domain/Secretion system C-terminal sorting domain
MAQTSFYDPYTIEDIRIYFASASWDATLDAAVANETYTVADSVVINGQAFIQVGVKYKGNSSYNANRPKNPFHIKLDYIVDQNYQGYEDLKLNNGFSDPSMMREISSYKILRQYMDGPKANLAKVYVNGNYHGIYTNAQDVGNRFNFDHYYTSVGAFVKCNPQNVQSGGGSGLLYTTSDSTGYLNQYELQSDFGWNKLQDFIDTLNNFSANIDQVLDVDRALWMLAFNDVLVNLDSYSGSFRQNYYLYRNHQHRWIPTVWDVNMSYGSFTMLGTNAGGGGPGGGGSLTLTTMQQMDPYIHINDSNWPLINKLLAVPMYKRMYTAHLRTMNRENFVNADYKTYIETMHAAADNAVSTDPNYLYTYQNFLNNLNSTITGGGPNGGTVGIYQLMDSRATYLEGTSAFAAVPPTISSVSSSTNSPTYLENVTITATVTNATAVYLGYRYKKSDVFMRTLMFDDGAHGDGGAADGVYGLSIPVQSLRIQYYIYADNNTAGIFSPERAEHEFHEIKAVVQMASSSDIVLNEVVSNNNSIITNEQGKTKDYIEVVNVSSVPLGLNSLCLSDDPSLPTKWQFPGSVLIQPGEHLLVWSDDNDNVYLDPHTNFNLTSTGEYLCMSDTLGNVFQTTTVPAQNIDEAWGRCYDSTGEFNINSNPSPRNINECVVLVDEMSNDTFSVFPVPALNSITVLSNQEIGRIEIFDFTGKRVLTEQSFGSRCEISIDSFQSGIYALRRNGGKIILIEKL